MKIAIVRAKEAHIPHIAEHMREMDRREVWASDRQTPEEALRSSFELSVLAWTCGIDGVPAFMWGVTRQGCILSDTGVPWLLGTDAMRKARREFLKRSRDYIEMMHREFSRLENLVHAENMVSIRWLKWCGFDVDEATPELINGEVFYRFWRQAQ